LALRVPHDEEGEAEAEDVVEVEVEAHTLEPTTAMNNQTSEGEEEEGPKRAAVEVAATTTEMNAYRCRKRGKHLY
jgi:hypothetical protein